MHITPNMLEIKLADFGFSIEKHMTEERERCGSPGYIAPEVIQGEMYDERSDIFSIGAIIYKVATRKVLIPDNEGG